MDFPMFHLDWLNDRFLIAAVAIIHVMINHGLAVGFIPYITWLEFKGVQRGGKEQIADWQWDRLIHNKMKVGFIITTTIGAMTGVGIWFTVALVSPSSIGSLIRVFYWAWFTEWMVFVTEVILISIYYLTWENANKTLRSKLKHVRFGAFLSVASWITMVIIVSILSFMMDPGNWNTHKSLFNGFTNPIYIPQLFFRTPVAMLMGGVFGILLTTLFTQKGSQLREQVVRLGGKWILGWTPLALGGAVYYWHAMPDAMKANMSTAVGSMDFSEYYDILKYFIVGSTSLSILLAVWAILKPKKVNFAVVLIPCLFVFGFLGIFERVREFIRKPYVIGGYMYSNLLREEDYPLYKKDGILQHATYTSVNKVTETNKIEAGKNVFMLTCSRCHTSNGINSIVDVFEKMYGKGKPLDEESMASYIPNMHQGRTFMPPFPGNKKELDALVAYIKELQASGEPLQGAQSEGVVVNPKQSLEQASKTYGDTVLVSKK
ncbi:cytochrome c [Sphingobacterium siyangense]|uniref:c-type cytochrome n=1 Tax=Sphingobacterium siyangense TaxID=459529 RepID=UPI00301672FC